MTTEVRRPPSWRLPVAIVSSVVVLAGAAILAAFLAVADDGEQLAAAPSPTPAATAPPATPTPTPGLEATPTPEAGATSTPEAGATPTPDDGTTEEPEAEPDPGATTEPDDGTGTEPGAGGTTPTPDDPFAAPTPDAGGTGSTDPGGTTGGAFADWPAGETAWTVVLFSGSSRQEAEDKAEDFAADGTSVGILRSDDYESLNPGYHVVFSGQYESRSEAQTAAEDLQDTASGAYARRVRPR